MVLFVTFRVPGFPEKHTGMAPKKCRDKSRYIPAPHNFFLRNTLYTQTFPRLRRRTYRDRIPGWPKKNAGINPGKSRYPGKKEEQTKTWRCTSRYPRALHSLWVVPGQLGSRCGASLAQRQKQNCFHTHAYPSGTPPPGWGRAKIGRAEGATDFGELPRGAAVVDHY